MERDSIPQNYQEKLTEIAVSTKQPTEHCSWEQTQI